MVEQVAAVQDGKDSAISEEFQELKDENERLRKSLTLLHTHSLRLQDQLEAVLGYRNTLPAADDLAACRVSEDPGSDRDPGALAGQFESTSCESKDGPIPNRWMIIEASNVIAR